VIGIETEGTETETGIGIDIGMIGIETIGEGMTEGMTGEMTVDALGLENGESVTDNHRPLPRLNPQ
jgi:hypothetical protein